MKSIETAISAPDIFAEGQFTGYGDDYRRVRGFSEALCRGLEPEDFVVQSMMEASPAKWHLAHTSWFFETFVLKPHYRGYRSTVPEYAYLFNSYYNAAGPMHCRDRRGLISRPTVAETFEYRRHIDTCMLDLFADAEENETLREALAPLIVLGLNHEQQHQELLLTDIKHLFAQNPLYPVYTDGVGGDAGPVFRDAGAGSRHPRQWLPVGEGLVEIGYGGGGFHYDNEGPRHRQFLEAFALSSRLVTNGEYRQFMEDGGYERSEHWLSLGWNTIRELNWKAPMYWEMKDGEWHQFTLSGLRRIEDDEPVCHVSFFEADAYARWGGGRLPTEAEWEVATNGLDPAAGNFVEEGRYHPAPVGSLQSGPVEALEQMFGDVWEWTGSAYRPYPGYKPPKGALGEYNGKFMCNQMVLRGGSCATSRTHIRPTYRNFFQPDKRWQFSGIRLARDER